MKLLDFKSEQELLVDPSPFAIASLVQLRKLQAGGDTQRRFDYKLALVRELYRRSYSRDDVLKLLRFIDYILKLPLELIERFRYELEKIEEEMNMPYLTSWEQKALEKGLEEGREEGREEGKRQGIVAALRQTLEVRFGELPPAILTSIEQCERVDQLHALHRQALTVDSLDELNL